MAARLAVCLAVVVMAVYSSALPRRHSKRASMIKYDRFFLPLNTGIANSYDRFFLLLNTVIANSYKLCLRLKMQFNYAYTLIYVWGTLGIRHVRSKYADIHRCTFVLYTEVILLDILKFYQRIAYTLLICLPYAQHTLDTLDIGLIR